MSRDRAHNLANARALRAAERYADAEVALLRTLEVAPADPDVLVLLAAVEHDLRQPQREAAALEWALEAGADPKLWARLGNLRSRLGDEAGSAAAFDRAVMASPDDLASWEGLARARFASGDLPGARSVADTMARRFPAAAVTHLFAGHLDKAMGNATSAERHYRGALSLSPRLGEALYALVDLGSLEDDEKLADAAAGLADDAEAAPTHRINAAFAYARIADRRGRYGDAMRYLHLGNELAHRNLAAGGVAYDPAAFEELVGRTIERYAADSFQHALAPLPVDLTPIFVIGLPRSGTTLIEQILAAHPNVQAAGELTAGPACERWFREQRQARDRHGPVVGEDKELLARARERYVDALFERGLDAEWVVDKLPGNFSIAGFLRLMFPDAPILHCVRDPRATAFSLYSANFAAHDPYYHDLHHIAHHHGQYVRLMRHWQSVLPHAPRDVRYEALVRDGDSGIPALLQAAGLPHHPACLRFHEQPRPILTASHAEVRQPLYTHAIDHWRHYQPWLGPVNDLASD